MTSRVFRKVRFRDDRSRASEYDPSALDPNSEFDQWVNARITSRGLWLCPARWLTGWHARLVWRRHSVVSVCVSHINTLNQFLSALVPVPQSLIFFVWFDCLIYISCGACCVCSSCVFYVLVVHVTVILWNCLFLCFALTCDNCTIGHPMKTYCAYTQSAWQSLLSGLVLFCMQDN